ncbi:MAG TPA: VUT family protein, partial [Blastocatellia bacterium]|nr:VUT family protein [Blastocatellia bacterium]
FLGAEGWTTVLVIKVTLFNYTLKVLWEIIATPFTYRMVKFLKQVEKEDYYDRDTNFNPFTLET